MLPLLVIQKRGLNEKSRSGEKNRFLRESQYVRKKLGPVVGFAPSTCPLKYFLIRTPQVAYND